MAAFRRLGDEFVGQHAHEKDPDVRQDLGVLIERVKNGIRGMELDSAYELPYVDPASQVFSGINALLTERLPDERRRKALDRLRKYAGLEPGTAPLATVATERIRRALNRRGLSMPPGSQVDRDLTQSPVVLAKVRSRLQRFGIPDYEPVMAELDRQIAQYHDFIREVDWQHRWIRMLKENSKTEVARAIPFERGSRLEQVLKRRAFLGPDAYVFGHAKTDEYVSSFRSAWETPCC